jgi:hypothetical protein
VGERGKARRSGGREARRQEARFKRRGEREERNKIYNLISKILNICEIPVGWVAWVIHDCIDEWIELTCWVGGMERIDDGVDESQYLRRGK